MKILPGTNISNWKEATTLALQTAGVDKINTDIVGMFASVAENDKTGSEADKIIAAAIKSRYGSKATWRAERWFVPVPKLQYDGKDIPQLTIEVNTYLVAAAAVRNVQNLRLVTLAGLIGRPDTLTIPMVFLHALLEKDLGRFAIVARDAGHTTWELPGAKPVRLPNDFVSTLAKMLQRQSVVAWLGEFGSQGRYIAPLVAGSLLGLAFQDSTQPVPVNRQMVTTDNLISALESMAYLPAEAREMVRRAAPRLRADMTFEEAIRIVLQMGKGGDLP